MIRWLFLVVAMVVVAGGVVYYLLTQRKGKGVAVGKSMPEEENRETQESRTEEETEF